MSDNEHIVIIITMNEKTFSLNYTHMKPSGKMIYMVNSEWRFKKMISVTLMIDNQLSAIIFLSLSVLCTVVMVLYFLKFGWGGD